MQSIEYKRFPIQMIGLLIAAAAAIVVVLIATGTVFDDNDTAVDRPRTEVRTSPVSRPMSRDHAMFLEWNTNLPDAGSAPVQDVVAPVAVRPAAVSFDRMLFLEMNTSLPGTAMPAVQPYEETRFLEMNQLPETQAPYFPDSQQSGGGVLTDY